MKFRLRLQLRATATFALVALGATAPFWTPPARTAETVKASSKKPAAMLQKPSEYWPGRRVLIVLPVKPGAAWSADAELARALAPLAQTQLQEALGATDKFSATSAHRFNPVFQRALLEKRLTEEDITPFVAAPSLEGAQGIVSKLTFEQPLMIADVRLEELIPGGTVKAPTTQLRISGKLYEQGTAEPVKTLEVTSRPAGGKTPDVRVSAAARQAFDELAHGFVTRLPVPNLVELMPPPPEPTPRPRPGRRGKRPATSAMVPNPIPSSAPTPGAAPVAPSVAPPAVATPNIIPSTPGAPIVPQLPAAQPPLDIAPGETTER